MSTSWAPSSSARDVALLSAVDLPLAPVGDRCRQAQRTSLAQLVLLVLLRTRPDPAGDPSQPCQQLSHLSSNMHIVRLTTSASSVIESTYHRARLAPVQGNHHRRVLSSVPLNGLRRRLSHHDGLWGQAFWYKLQQVLLRAGRVKYRHGRDRVWYASAVLADLAQPMRPHDAIFGCLYPLAWQVLTSAVPTPTSSQHPIIAASQAFTHPHPHPLSPRAHGTRPPNPVCSSPSSRPSSAPKAVRGGTSAHGAAPLHVNTSQATHDPTAARTQQYDVFPPVRIPSSRAPVRAREDIRPEIGLDGHGAVVRVVYT